MSSSPRPDRVLPDVPTHRPLERFWPYAELSEQPTEAELAALQPELREVLFGTPALPFSITIVFADKADASLMTRAASKAAAADDYVVLGDGDAKRHRARFIPGDRPERLRDLYEVVGNWPETEVLIDNQAVPYARELWLPLVWFLIR